MKLWYHIHAIRICMFHKQSISYKKWNIAIFMKWK
ncbi:hypothetical protein CLOBOL_00252 [Enterocloster bolteae ATCC BAA-613]|uniref:Uncharacterized protein n=1 Tax=Enterocloster bolteae (strain ATCC BAA-613 / DSM 15670 / CCUG 46953 / JCM 12243 / WAL 16351) TaxID=411902 RepID=A8RGX3_ENTBW|nr:hypothetical protein CLOBOL_00252 [Enterocloster bolteae ATCC BAA-613]